MQECWKYEPDERPTFKMIADELESLLEDNMKKVKETHVQIRKC